MTDLIEQVTKGQSKKMSMEEWQQWSAKMIDEDEQRRMDQRLSQGIGKSVIFFPFQGEFGHRWMHHVRFVHFIKDVKDKIVCCKKGEEVCYPSATGCFY